jgi:hypothetical protein
MLTYIKPVATSTERLFSPTPLVLCHLPNVQDFRQSEAATLLCEPVSDYLTFLLDSHFFSTRG